jgi:hypothetical protein
VTASASCPPHCKLADQEILADIVNGDDIGLVQSGHGSGFLLEVLAAPRMAREIFGQDDSAASKRAVCR